MHVGSLISELKIFWFDRLMELPLLKTAFLGGFLEYIYDIENWAKHIVSKALGLAAYLSCTDVHQVLG